MVVNAEYDSMLPLYWDILPGVTNQDLHRQHIKGKATVGRIMRAATTCSFLRACPNVQAPLPVA